MKKSLLYTLTVANITYYRDQEMMKKMKKES